MLSAWFTTACNLLVSATRSQIGQGIIEGIICLFYVRLERLFVRKHFLRRVHCLLEHGPAGGGVARFVEHACNGEQLFQLGGVALCKAQQMDGVEQVAPCAVDRVLRGRMVRFNVLRRLQSIVKDLLYRRDGCVVFVAAGQALCRCDHIAEDLLVHDGEGEFQRLRRSRHAALIGKGRGVGFFVVNDLIAAILAVGQDCGELPAVHSGGKDERVCVTRLQGGGVLANQVCDGIVFTPLTEISAFVVKFTVNPYSWSGSVDSPTVTVHCACAPKPAA